MIRITKIEIIEFRGIRKLILDLGGNNFAVCGPNGTGKSGVVDALEFGLTGNISRLAGAGTGTLSVKQHGPHVDSANAPDKALVTLHIDLPHLKKSAKITRTVANARTLQIEPDETDIRAVLDEVALHPEFALSRRQLIKYILSEPTKRSTEVQELLRLEEIGKLRTVLTRISNDAAKTVKPAEQRLTNSRADLLRILDITGLTPELLLAGVNIRRRVLGLPELTAFEATTSIKDGLTSRARDERSTRVSKTHAQADLTTLSDSLSALNDKAFLEQCRSVADQCAELANDSAVLQGVTRSELLQRALEQFDGEHCPVCDTEWEEQVFRAHLAKRLTHFEGAKAKRDIAERALLPVSNAFALAQSALINVAKIGPLLDPPIDVSAIQNHASALSDAVSQFGKLLPLDKTEAILREQPNASGVAEVISELAKAIAAIPEPTEQDAALEYLFVGQEKLEAYRTDARNLRTTKDKSKTAKDVLDKYEAVTTKALDEIYKAVESHFQELYRALNRDDEGGFTASLTPSLGKLGFDVDFYGRGKFPPGAYHSEGHQDAMGLCLYLALMKYLLGDSFTFAVLDDVLMSVDAGHRREVCTMLSTVFPGTQFVLTTHDRVWLEHMKSQGLVKSAGYAHFRKWTVDTGPMNWDDNDIWKEITDCLNRNEVSAAAAALRNYLEYAAAEAAHRLRARVEYRADGHHGLNDLIVPAIAEYAGTLKKAKNAANSWNKQEEVAAIEKIETDFATVRAASFADQWELNASTHYNEWARLDRKDLEPLVDAFHKLLDAMRCPKCASGHYVTPAFGKAEALRCRCGDLNLSLVQK